MQLYRVVAGESRNRVIAKTTLNRVGVRRSRDIETIALAKIKIGIVADLLNRRNWVPENSKADIGITVTIGINQDRRGVAARLNRDITAAELRAADLDDVAIADVLDDIAIQFRRGTAKGVAAGTAIQGVGSRATGDEIVADLTAYFIIAGASTQDIATGAAIDRVIAAAAIDHIRAGAAGNQVIASVTTELKPDIASIDRVISAGRDIDLGGRRIDIGIADHRAIAGELELLDAVIVQHPVLHPDQIVQLEEITFSGLNEP